MNTYTRLHVFNQKKLITEKVVNENSFRFIVQKMPSESLGERLDRIGRMALLLVKDRSIPVLRKVSICAQEW